MSAPPPEPFLFGQPRVDLYGCYHPPGGTPRSTAVVCSYPLDQEYLRSHRAFQKLAERLAAKGFPVLRFDFSACGDSAGDCLECTLPAWAEDLDQAIAEVRRRSGVEAVCLVGLRLGAATGALSAARRGDLAAAVLWDPVVRGGLYLDELRDAHHELVGSIASGSKSPTPHPHLELMGFPFPDGLLAELGSIDLLGLERTPAPRVLLVESGGPAEPTARLAEHLGGLGAELSHEQVEDPCIWREDASKALVPAASLKLIVEWIDRSTA